MKTKYKYIPRSDRNKRQVISPKHGEDVWVFLDRSNIVDQLCFAYDLSEI